MGNTAKPISTPSTGSARGTNSDLKKRSSRKGKWRILHIDSDADFTKRIEQYAQIAQVEVVVCTRAEDLDFLPNVREFDLLLLDSQINSVTATQMIHRLGTEIPVILTNRKNLPYPSDVNWQLLNIQQYFANELGADPVWQSVLGILKKGKLTPPSSSWKRNLLKWTLLFVPILLIYLFF